MIQIEAPYPNTEIIVVLPEPELGNAKATTSNIKVKRMMDQSIETYINKRQQNTYRFHFIIPKLKALEILNFMEAYIGSLIHLTGIEHNIIGYFTKNPTELEIQRRAVSQNSQEDLDLELVVEEA